MSAFEPLSPAAARTQLEGVVDAASTILLGKREVLRLAVTCLVAGGHLLLEDLPGVGKTTLAHTILGVTAPDKGAVVTLDGNQLAAHTKKRPIDHIRAIQIVFQNPYGSLNPRQKIGHALEEPLLVNTTIGAMPAGPAK
jgi:dipeptide transport system ATP-binding protein